MSKGKADGKGKAAVEEPESEEAEGEGQEGIEDAGGEDVKAENARLKAENEELRKKAAPAPAVPAAPAAGARVNSAQLRALSEEEWATIEEKTGRNRAEILANVERQEIARDNAELKARINVQDAIEEAVAADATVGRLKAGIREYLAEVPLEDRGDPERLKRHMERAKTYARGKLAGQGGGGAPAKPRGAAVEEPGPDAGEGEEGEETPAVRGGAVKPGAEIAVGKLRLKVSDLIPPERRTKMKHPDDPNGVMFRGVGKDSYDKPPVFRR